MSNTNAARWLADFYQKVAEGGQMQRFNGVTAEWVDVDEGPWLRPDLFQAIWRVKSPPRTWQVFVPNDTALKPHLLSLPDDKFSDGTVVEVIEVIK